MGLNSSIECVDAAQTLDNTPTWYEIYGMPEPDDSLTTPGGELPEVDDA